MSKLPHVWRKITEPEAGLYDLITLAGWEPDTEPRVRHVLYIVKSREGYLTEAFTNSQVGKTWAWLAAGEQDHAGS